MMLVRCALGHAHYGTHGAAGLLIARPTPDGTEVLLQKRARGRYAGTYSIPGGLLETGETPLQAALRECREELGLRPDQLRTGASYEDRHGNWTYTSFVAQPVGVLAVEDLRPNYETSAVGWAAVEDVHLLRLHPAFAASLPHLLELLP